MIFSLAVELVDVLHRYFVRRVPLSVIWRIILLYYPKCLVLSLPAALLFSVTYTMGDFYAHNELIAVFCSGISLRQLTIPLIVIGLLLSVLVFFFEDLVVVRTLRTKNQLYREAVGVSISLSDTNLLVTSVGGQVVFHAATFDQESSQLTRTVILELDSARRLVSRMDANRARWNGDKWIFEGVRRYTWRERILVEERFEEYIETRLTLPDEAAFETSDRNMDEMRFRDGLSWSQDLRRNGRAYRSVLVDTYNKISFATTPLFVTLVGVSLGGLFRKNVFLMSSLLSLAVVFLSYVLRALSDLLAKSGVISPVGGALGGALLVLAVSVILFRVSRS